MTISIAKKRAWNKKWMRAWRRANPELAREIRKRRRENPETRLADLEKGREWARKHYERNLVRRRKWTEANHAKLIIDRRRWDGLPAPLRPEPERCECCRQLPRKPRRSLSLDHCHVSHTFRGWLCNRCNVGIGALGDSVDGIARALEYLREARKNVRPHVASWEKAA